MRAKKITALLVAMGALALTASPASASEAINSFTVSASSTQAGGHPDLNFSFELYSPGMPEAAKDAVIETPQGVFGNPNAITRCTSVDFALEQCPPASQAGLITIRANHNGNPNELLGTAGIYDLAPAEDQTALFGFVVPTLGIHVTIPVAVRTGGDYGLRFTVQGMTQLAPLASADLTWWGFPADPSHDGDRFPKGRLCPGAADTSCLGGASTPAQIPVHPLIDSPSQCTGETSPVILRVTTYQDPGNPTTASADYPEVDGCFDMTFKPVLFANPTTTQADSPSGLDLTMNAPQPLGRATTPSPIHAATLTLPPGFTINPDAADGQSACPDEAANFGTEAPGACPDRAKIGTFAIFSPALDGPLNGSVYFGEPKPGDQYRFFLIADGFGIHVKLAGSFHPDPQTGQLTATLEDLPQVPFDSFELHLFASDRGLMATPTQCSIYEVQAHFFPWNDKLPDQTSRQLFSIDSGPNGEPCPGQVRPFEPRLFAGTSDPSAGGFSNFALQLDRDDGDQFLGELNFTMPPGFTGSLRGIVYCPEGAIAHAAANPGRTELAVPSCPAASQIGTSNVAAGPGSHPFHTTGRIYMAGPFKGAPFSLVVVTPALAGPYDYGTQVVRVALHVDPLDAHVTALSDAVPQIIGGVPLRLRSIRVSLDRPNFIINPTDCSPKSIASQGVGDEGTAANFSSHFHAVNCFALPFRPKMRMRLRGGRRSTHRSADPALTFDLWTRPGDANIKRVTVTLPNAFQIDQSHLGNICSETELAQNDCAGRQAIGAAWTKTPLLDQPIAGKAYAVSGGGGLPRLAFVLDGQVKVVPRGHSKTVGNGKLMTVVPVVPDAPVGHFRFNLYGGKKGYLANTRDLCRHPTVAVVKFVAQNGKTLRQRMPLKGACGKQRHTRRRAHHRVR